MGAAQRHSTRFQRTPGPPQQAAGAGACGCWRLLDGSVQQQMMPAEGQHRSSGGGGGGG
eukprot:COSAG01_NODE_28208_length_666_cov_1.696649_1_plen_58_part_10